MSKSSINRTIRIPNDLDAYLEGAVLETGRTRSDLVLESIKAFRSGAIFNLQAPGIASLESKLDTLLGIVGQQADQIATLASKVTELADEAPVHAHTHRLVFGLNKSVGALFRNVDGLLADLGFQPAVKRVSETSTGDGVDIKAEGRANSQAQISPATKLNTSPTALPADVEAWVADLPLNAKGQHEVNLFSGPPAKTEPVVRSKVGSRLNPAAGAKSRPAPAPDIVGATPDISTATPKPRATNPATEVVPTLTTAEEAWLNTCGHRLPEPNVEMKLIMSPARLEARIRALHESGAVLPPIPGAEAGINNLVTYMIYLASNTERSKTLDRLLGLRTVSGMKPNTTPPTSATIASPFVGNPSSRKLT